uniref:Uncharacterized protein n=1 Tax=Glossina austeni TaxID=7395 RepID=A0A1A9UZJ6_GLOAU
MQLALTQAQFKRACAPRFVFHTMTPTKNLRHDPIGTCFTSRNFTHFNEVSPCRTKSIMNVLRKHAMFLTQSLKELAYGIIVANKFKKIKKNKSGQQFEVRPTSKCEQM